MAKKKEGINEDWLSFWLAIVISIIAFLAFTGIDPLGWGINTNVWTDPSKALAPTGKAYMTVKGEITKIEGNKVTLKKADGKEEAISVKDTAGLTVGDKYEKKGLSGFTSLILTYLFLMVVMGIGAGLLRASIGKFVIGFTILFWLSYLCWFLGSNAYIAAVDASKAGVPWSLKLTPEAGFIIALIAGLIIGNFFEGFADFLKEAIRPELYIKTGIGLMGILLGIKAATSFSLASAVLFRGLCAIIEAYLIYWAFVYLIARKYFKFNREWAAPLASGISICGVSAAIATGGAIKARPMVPIMVSSLVVVFAVTELIILPFFAQTFLWKEPMVAGAWMGLAVKSDGAAFASGAVVDALIRAKAEATTGVKYEPGWMLMAASTTKLFIDIFISIWAFILAIIWSTKIEAKAGEKIQAAEIWARFPKFVLPYAAGFIIMLLISFPAASKMSAVEKDIKAVKKEVAALEKDLPTAAPEAQPAIQEKINASKDKINGLDAQIKEPKKTLSQGNTAANGANAFRVMFFLLTFFAIGVVSNFKKLWEEGIGKLAVIYVVALFGFIIWVGLIISWIFFHGVMPPVITG